MRTPRGAKLPRDFLIAMSKRKACSQCGHNPEGDVSDAEDVSNENDTPNKRGKKTISTYFDSDFDVATEKNIVHAEKHLCKKYGFKQPLAGNLDLVYKGEGTRGKGLITATSVIDLAWRFSYQPLGHRGPISIKSEIPFTI